MMSRTILIGVWTASLLLAFWVGRGTLSPVVEDMAAAPEDMGAAVRAALGEGAPLKRFGQLSDALEHLDAESLPEVLDVYEMMLSGSGDCDIRIFADAWSGFDPRGAFNHIMTWKGDNKRMFGRDAVIRGWAIRNPIEARAAISEIIQENPRIREGLVEKFLTGWAHSGQSGLTEYIAGIQTNKPEKYFALVGNAILRRSGPDAVMAWAEPIFENSDYPAGFKRGAFRISLRTTARWAPEAAAAFAEPYLNEEWADDGPRVVADRWGETDGRAALEWAKQLEEGPSRESAVREAFLSWNQTDEKAAEAWLLAEEWEAFHDPALNQYARNQAGADPVRAIELCEQVFDDERRNGCLLIAAKSWYAKDAVEAEEWLQRSALDEEARAKVRRTDQGGTGEGKSPRRPGRRGGSPSRQR